MTNLERLIGFGIVSCFILLIVLFDDIQKVNGHERDSSKIRPNRSPQRSNRRHVTTGRRRCDNDFASNHDDFDALGSKIREVAFVFTGKVISIVEEGEERSSLQVDGHGEDVDREGGRKTLGVRVKRWLKGRRPEAELAKPHAHQTVQVAVVAGKGAAARGCYHLLRVHHTAIFLAAQHDNHTLRLVSNPLTLALRNLDRVNAAVKDMSYKPRPPIIEEPCEKTFCAFGANCVTDTDGRARCQCPVDCPNVFTPVCGTDGTTYANHCLLRKKSCQDKKNTRVQHSGECGAQRTASRRRS